MNSSNSINIDNNDQNNSDLEVFNLENKIFSQKNEIYTEFNYNKIMDQDNNLECSICLEEITEDDNVHILSCNHSFHSECLYEWYNRPKTDYCCPLCTVQREVVKIKEPKKNEIRKSENTTIKETSKKHCGKCHIM